MHDTPASMVECTAKETIAVFDITATQAFFVVASDLMTGQGLGRLEGHPALVTGSKTQLEKVPVDVESARWQKRASRDASTQQRNQGGTLAIFASVRADLPGLQACCEGLRP